MRVYNKKDARGIIEEAIKILDFIDLEEDQIEFEGLEIDADGIEIETTPTELSQLLPKLAEEKVEIEKFEPNLME